MKASLAMVGSALQLVDLPPPNLDAGQVLVRVKASGVNPLDLKIHAGQAAHAKQPLPAILGRDLAGIVDSAGDGTTPLLAGDEVWGMTGGVAGLPGTLAQYAAVDARLLAKKPSCLSMHEAAALPLAAITAWEGLFDRMRMQPGQNLLVLGGAGGVGHVVVQLALAHGLRVFATASTDDLPYLTSLGSEAIDRHTPIADLRSRAPDAAGFDLVYDTVGGAALDTAFQAVRQFGHVVSCLGWGTHSLAPLSFRAGTYSGVFTLQPLLSGSGREHHGEILRQVARLAETGKLKPRLDSRRFTLSTAAHAHALLQGRGARGKVVIDVD